MNKKIYVGLLVLVLIAAVIPFTPAMPPTEYVVIPSDVPEELWGHSWGLLIGGGVNLGGQTESGTFGWLPG